MIFFKSGSYELEMIFTKGKDDGNSIVTVAGSISGSKNEETISLELSQQTHREEAAPSFLFFFLRFLLLLFCNHCLNRVISQAHSRLLRWYFCETFPS